MVINIDVHQSHKLHQTTLCNVYFGAIFILRERAYFLRCNFFLY